MFEDLFEKIMQDKTKKDFLEKSIVMNGPVGSGKSLLSSQLSKMTGMPVISADLCRHLPSIEKLNSTDISSLNPTELSRFQQQSELRKILPNLETYSTWGFRKAISCKMREKYGPVAWHFYQKQFETRLFLELVEKLNQPVILDLGGGMGISMDKHYNFLETIAKKKNPEMFEKIFPLKDFIGFDKIKKIMEKFENVVCLQLPSNYKSYMDKAKNEPLNFFTMSTGQYQQTATIPVDVSYLYNKNKPNWKRATIISENILTEASKNNKHSKTLENSSRVL